MIVDGVENSQVNQYLSSTLWQTNSNVTAGFTGLHHVKMERLSGSEINLNYITVQ